MDNAKLSRWNETEKKKNLRISNCIRKVNIRKMNISEEENKEIILKK